MKQSAKRSLRPVPAVGMTLLALALGGSTELGAQAVVVLLAAVVILLFPPRLVLGRVPAVLILLFLGLAFSAFLPAAWGMVPEWRRHLTDDLHVPLGDLRTPQPWLTLQACGLLIFGLVWMCYLFAQEWTLAEKSQALRLLTGGIVFLAAVSIAAHLTGYRLPGWNEELNRGWFPNRNQTADVLALAGMVNYAIVFKNFEKKKWTGVLWLAGLALICTALVICYSRAGVIMFFGGIALWHLDALFRPGEGKKLAVGLSFVLLLLSLFLLFGGTTLDRFMNSGHADLANAPEYRMLIQTDAVRVSLQAPFLGTGLGNFEPVFTSMRQASADQNRAIHPESDWLWMAVEMGWIAPILVLAGLYWWWGRCRPFTLNAGESMRRVALVAFIMFIGHGFVDVSGHRPGSLLTGLLLAGVALAPAGKESIRRPWIAPLFRGLALVLALIGTWWLISACADVGPPTTATLDRMQARINTAAGDGLVAKMGEIAQAGLEIVPLNWSFYFRRATAEAFRAGATEQAEQDFQIARFLEPNWIDLCMNEGEVWMAVDQPKNCINAWLEALRRAGPNETYDYEAMLRLAKDSAEVHRGLRQAAATNDDYLLAFLQYATPDEEKEEIDALLARDPNLQSLTDVQQERLFAAWYSQGNQDDLAQALLSHADWQVAGWSFLARHFASQQDFEMASLTALKFMTPPVLLPTAEKSSGGSDGKGFDAHPDDVVEGILLCQSQMEANRTDDALATIAKLEKLKECPSYIYYYEAQLDVKKQQWEPAWNAVRQFAGL